MKFLKRIWCAATGHRGITCERPARLGSTYVCKACGGRGKL